MYDLHLTAVRHGSTEWNAARRFQGHTDIPLNEEGRAQAHALQELLCAEPIEYAAASDLLRAHETARILLGARVLPLALDPDWREMHFGSWEGLTWEEISAAHPELEYATQPKFFLPPGGESFEQLCARIAAAAQRVSAALPAGGHALVVTHAGPLHALLRVLDVVSEEEALRVRFQPLSLLRFTRSGGVWRTENELPGA